MHITIDNIFAFLVLVLILVTFMGYIIPSAYLSFTTVKEHQLEEIAQAVMDKILLSPGYPEDWGDITLVESEEDLMSFGLQKAGGEPYELDIDKVLRIASVDTSSVKALPDTVRIHPVRIAELLGLGKGYEFSIRIMPALNITGRVTERRDFQSGGQQHSIPEIVEVTVKTPEGRPAINANVTGLYVFMNIRKKEGGDVSYSNYTFVTGRTDREGRTTLDFTRFVEEMVEKLGNELKRSCSTVIVYADYYGIRAINTTVFEHEMDGILKGMAVGNYLVVEFPYELNFTPAARHLGPPGNPEVSLANPPYYVYTSGFEDDSNGESGWIINRGHYNFRVYELSSFVDDDVSLMILPAKYTGTYYAIPFYRAPSEVVCQQWTVAGNVKTSVLRRMVKVGSFHYIFELRVWRGGE